MEEIEIEREGKRKQFLYKVFFYILYTPRKVLPVAYDS